MVKHPKELVEVVPHHYEVQWTLKLEAKQGAFEPVDLCQDRFFQIGVELPKGTPHKGDFRGRIILERLSLDN